MKGLRKVLTPFAPDQSGAVSVLYECGGLIVVIDAGGCTGNICGFDEPRWSTVKSCILSAGLRDMDAILGRDKQLIEKIKKAIQTIDASFIALIGTPVPAVIATDYQGIKHLLEKELNIPVLTLETTGVGLYDKGIEEAYLQMFKTFPKESDKNHKIGIIGYTPLDFLHIDYPYTDDQYLTYRYLEDYKQACNVDRHIVISPSGLKAAKYMKRKYGIDYICDYDYTLPSSNKKTLIIHSQILANSIRERCFPHATVASYFMMKKEIMKDGDVHLVEEDDLLEIVHTNHYELIVGDDVYKDILKDYSGEWISLPHFSVSGKQVYDD